MGRLPTQRAKIVFGEENNIGLEVALLRKCSQAVSTGPTLIGSGEKHSIFVYYPQNAEFGNEQRKT